MSAVIPSTAGRPPAAIHVDLDGAAHIYRNHGWEYGHADDPLFRGGLKNLLAFLARNEIKATLFVIAEDTADARKQDLLREAVDQGHEIASHSLTHARLDQLDSAGKTVEIVESRRRLEDSLGVTVRGFRAPSYSVDRECLELLEQDGYGWDSSTFPTREFARRLRVERVPQQPHRPLGRDSIVELPLPRYRPAPFPFHPSYSLLLGRRYFGFGLRRFRRTGRPMILLFHLTDLADPLPAEHLNGPRSRIMTLSHLSAETKARRCQAMLDLAREHYDVIDTSALLSMQVDS